MPCENTKTAAIHSGLCKVHYPYVRHAASSTVKASHLRDCTLQAAYPAPPANLTQSLGYEANTHLVNLDEFKRLVPNDTTFGTYTNASKTSGSKHFCVDNGRRTVDGRRLNWLWIYPQGKVRFPNKLLADQPSFIWSKQNIIDAYEAANNPTLPMWTRHEDTISELILTFCLRFPD